MPGAILRNTVVRFFGTPASAEGSVNEPRERVEHGIRFNEKWVYRRPKNDPTGAFERVVYWRRYDYVGSMIRAGKDDEWQRDEGLPAALSPSSVGTTVNARANARIQPSSAGA